MPRITQDDLDRLNAFLLSLDEEAMLLSELHGYLSGIIVCPELIPPEQWLSPIWADQAVFETLEEANEILALIKALNNDIVLALGRPGAYVPFLDADKHGMVWELWASGFGRALDLNPEAWAALDALGDDDPNAMALRLLDTLAHAADEPGGGGLPEDLEQVLRTEAETLIAACVEDLHVHRLAVHGLERVKKIGPNTLCPCGSGKKYKRCCGEPGVT